MASHARSYVRGGFTTIPEHMPKAHRDHAEWTPTRMIRWAGTVGPKAGELVTAILDERPHPEQGYRACLGILRLERRYGGGTARGRVRTGGVRARPHRREPAFDPAEGHRSAAAAGRDRRAAAGALEP